MYKSVYIYIFHNQHYNNYTYTQRSCLSSHTIRCFDNAPSLVGDFVVKNDPQRQLRGYVPLAWPSPCGAIHPFRGQANPRPRHPDRKVTSSNESARTLVSVSAKDGQYREVASLHIPIITKSVWNSRNVTFLPLHVVWGPESQVSGPQAKVR